MLSCGRMIRLQPQPPSPINSLDRRHTVHKMDLILHSIERMLKMQFSMGRKFTLQPLCRYDIKPSQKKHHKHNFSFDAPCLQKAKQPRLGANQGSLDLQPETLPMRHTDNCF